MGFRRWIRRLLGREVREWNFPHLPGGTSGVPAPGRGIAAPRTEPSRGAVVLGFEDGSEVVLPHRHHLVKDFIKLADKMMRRTLVDRLVRR